MREALRLAAATWHPTRDGVLMMDYSSQSLGERKGKHTESLVPELFRGFLTDLDGLEVDMMLEIKDKEASAVKAIGILRELGLVPPAPAGYAPPTFGPRSAAPPPRPRKTKPSTEAVTEAVATAKPKRRAKTAGPQSE
jgi:UV DNA damage endonuclease